MNNTRHQILLRNYESIKLHGFQGTRADRLVSDLGVTKGALYHYFPNKYALGYAILDEIVAPEIVNKFRNLEVMAENRPVVLVNFIREFKAIPEAEIVNNGWSIMKIMMEMAALDEGFKERTRSIYEGMIKSIALCVEVGQTQGFFSGKEAINFSQYILATIQGAFAVGKGLGNKCAFDEVIEQLALSIETPVNKFQG